MVRIAMYYVFILMIKDVVLDDDRLKQGNATFGKDYFRELLERVRSIRASERRKWQQITGIFPSAVLTTTKHPRSQNVFTQSLGKII